MVPVTVAVVGVVVGDVVVADDVTEVVGDVV